MPRILLTLSVLGIASNGCVRWGESEQEEERAGCGTTGTTDSDDGFSDSYDDDGFNDDDEDPTVSAGGQPTPDVPPEEPDWPMSWPVDPDAAVVVWGKTGIPTRNLDLMRNIYLRLGTAGAGETGSSTSGSTGGDTDVAPTTSGASSGPLDTDGDTDAVDTDGTGGVATGTGGTGGETDGTTTGDDPEPVEGVNVLWIGDCDPRTDEVGCLAGNVQPYFAMVDAIGTVDFRLLSEVDPAAYDVIVADFCGPVSATAVGELLGDGARVLVLGDAWCVRDGQTSAAAANELLEHIGTRFDGNELYNHDFLVADEARVGILEGIERVDAWGLSLQGIGPDFEALLGTPVGTLLSSRGVQ